MKILSCVMDEERMGWMNAFRHAGHDFRFLDRPIFDVFHSDEPDIVIINNEVLTKDISQCIQKSSVKTYNIDTHKPNFSCDPYTFYGGSFKSGYESKISIFGSYSDDNVNTRAISNLIEKNPNDVKIYGFGAWPFPQYVGGVTPSQLCNVTFSCDICYFGEKKSSTTLYNMILAKTGRYTIKTFADIVVPSRKRIIENDTCVHRMNEVLEKAK